MATRKQPVPKQTQLKKAQPVSWPGDEPSPPRELTMDEVLRDLPPEEWFPSASADLLPSWWS